MSAWLVKDRRATKACAAGRHDLCDRVVPEGTPGWESTYDCECRCHVYQQQKDTSEKLMSPIELMTTETELKNDEFDRSCEVLARQEYPGYVQVSERRYQVVRLASRNRSGLHFRLVGKPCGWNDIDAELARVRTEE